MKENITKEKTYKFSVRILKLCRFLKTQREFSIADQLFRSGTSIGANVEEACGAQSRGDFISKIAVAYKEARETHYWLRLLKDGEIIDEKLANSFLKDLNEILKLLGKTYSTAKKNSSKNKK